MMTFDFTTAGRIIFGRGSLKDAGPAVSKMGTRAFIVTGTDQARVTPLLRILDREKITFLIHSLTGEPTVEGVAQASALARNNDCDFVVGMGGGSVMDAAKAVAAMITNDGELVDYLEIIGKGKKLTRQPSLSLVIPTTAGTGAEVTANSVIMSKDHGIKVSMRDPMMLADLVIVDPELTLTLPPSVTAETGMDALTQLLEAFVSVKANSMTDVFCTKGLAVVGRSLRSAYDHGGIDAREDLSLGALFSGLALANGGLGAVHGIAGPMGGMIPIPHGAACGALLGPVMRGNIRALKSRDGLSPVLSRYRQVARILTESPTATVQDGIEWVEEIVSAMKISPLKSHGLEETHIPPLVKKAGAASSMGGNPVVLNDGELEEIILMAM